MTRDRVVWVAVIVVGGIVGFVTPYVLPISETGDRFAVALARGLLMGGALAITVFVANRLTRRGSGE